MDRKMIDYLPEIMKKYVEFNEISNAEQKAKEELWEDVYRMFYEGYVSTESIAGADRWEKTLGIVPKDTEDIEVRNFRIRGRIQQDLPYTYRTLKRQLTGLCGEGNFTISLDMDKSEITIKVALKRKELRDEVNTLTDEIVPAHLLLTVTLMYNTHRMISNTGLTNAQLSAYTHIQLAEQPFE